MKNGDFVTLPIQGGVGHFHVNRFRIYFTAKTAADAQDPAPVIKDFIVRFPEYFNPSNVAQVAWIAERPYAGRPSLRFEFDVRVAWDRIDVPNLHADWVGVCWEDEERGFAGQTLMRKFIDVAEDAVALLPGVGVSLAMKNRKHFLAGRRSWIFRHYDAEAKSGKSKIRRTGGHHRFVYAPIMMLETAAVERYSDWMYDVVAKDEGGVIMSSIRQSILRIWPQLLENYCACNDLGIVHPAHMMQWKKLGNVYYNVKNDIMSEAECWTVPWIAELLSMHPGLAAQLSSSAGTGGGFRSGGGDFGGGGTSGGW